MFILLVSTYVLNAIPNLVDFGKKNRLLATFTKVGIRFLFKISTWFQERMKPPLAKLQNNPTVHKTKEHEVNRPSLMKNQAGLG
jgi:hypothetical protein